MYVYTHRDLKALRHAGIGWRCRLAIWTGLWGVGARLHPQAVTDAWYASDCDSSTRPGFGKRDWLTWKIACFLRGC